MSRGLARLSLITPHALPVWNLSNLAVFGTAHACPGLKLGLRMYCVFRFQGAIRQYRPDVGYLMKRLQIAFFVSVLAVVGLVACSGLPNAGGGGGGGNGSLLLTASSAPPTPPPNSSILSFTVTVTGVSLTPSSGSPVNIPLPGTTYVLDLTRLESDSAFLGNVLNTVPAGTYTNITLAISGASVTFCTQLNPGVAGCSSGSVAKVTSGAAAPVISKSITITASQTTALRIQLDFSKALTINPATQVVTAVNLGAVGAFSASTIPPASSSLSAGQSDFVEDFTGIVTAKSGSAVTVVSSKHGAITVTANSSTFFSPNCTAPPVNSTSDINCVKINQLASIDAVLNSNGTFTLLAYDPLEVTASDWVEGLVTETPSSSTQFHIVANDAFLAAAGSLIGSNLSLSDRVTVNLASGATFGVDSKGLIVPAEAATFNNANDTSVLRPGQTVAVHVTSFTAASGSTPASVTANFVGLRLSRVSGSVSSTAPPNVFFVNNLPPFFGITTQQKVQLNQAIVPQSAPTNFDGVADASGLTNSQTVSFRALYFGSASATPFSAAKVRTH